MLLRNYTHRDTLEVGILREGKTATLRMTPKAGRPPCA